MSSSWVASGNLHFNTLSFPSVHVILTRVVKDHTPRNVL